MTDLPTVEPGWILLLPPDAHGERRGHRSVAGGSGESGGATHGPTRATATQPAGRARHPSGPLAFSPSLTSATAAFAFTAVLFVSFLFAPATPPPRPRHEPAATAPPQPAAGEASVQPAVVRAEPGDPARPGRCGSTCAAR